MSRIVLFSLAAAVVLTGVVTPRVARAAAALEGYLSAGAMAAEGNGASWRDGGFGRLDLGSAGDDGEAALTAESLLLLEVGEGSPVSLVLQAALRQTPAAEESRAAGIAQAFGVFEKSWGQRQENSVRLRLGFFFLPSSRENTEVGWSSPYTLTFSALNTWIGEEVRPTGLEAAYSRRLGPGELTATALAFGGNDAAGALLAWRGFAMASRVALWGEVLPLPPLPSLARNDQFGWQRDAGSKSFGDDLDGRVGYFFALRWHQPERFLIQADHWDNRGDRHLYGGDYAWATRYDHLAVELDATAELKLIGEWMQGEAGMGRPTRAHVDIDFEAAYLLASWHRGPFRLSLRRDEFRSEDHDGTTEPNDDEGDAWTAALLVDSPSKAWRFGLEWLEAQGEHPAAAAAGADPATRDRSLRFEVRFYFGS